MSKKLRKNLRLFMRNSVPLSSSVHPAIDNIPCPYNIVLISKVVSANGQIKYSNFPFDDFRYFLGQELEYLFGRKDINKVVH